MLDGAQADLLVAGICLPVKIVLLPIAALTRPLWTEEETVQGRTKQLCIGPEPKQGVPSESKLALRVQAGAGLGRASRCPQLELGQHRTASDRSVRPNAARRSQ